MAHFLAHLGARPGLPELWHGFRQGDQYPETHLRRLQDSAAIGPPCFWRPGFVVTDDQAVVAGEAVGTAGGLLMVLFGVAK